ncbi:hypothetical protein BZA77DRAFT_273932 [Pyronema omphalodes]|nr:hypothetical protein BZA77DRAFT_273932 [Pyronema omphalodes]
MPPFRDDHILIIAPGSQTTLAQLGLPESFSPPKMRIPSRMFPGIEEGTWTFKNQTRDSKKEDLIAQAKGQKAAEAAVARATSQADDAVKDEDKDDGEDDGDDDDGDEDEDMEDGEVKDGSTPSAPGPPTENKDKAETSLKTEADGDDDMEDDMGEGIYIEDEDDEEGAVWCMKEGRVVDWGCFFALLTYVHEVINPTFHTPILLVHPPEFTLQDKQMVTQFVFEKLKTPGFCLMDSAMTALYAYGLSTATVIDVGFEKTDITPISDFTIFERARKTLHNCGGQTMTAHLQTLLPDLKPEDVETLKKSPICEILPLGSPFPGSGEAVTVRPPHVVATTVDEERDALISEEEGTVNVAAIVASGKTHEFLAKREKQRMGEAERRLPNRERETNTFWVVDKRRPGEDEDIPLPSSALTSPVTTTAPELPAPNPVSPTVDDEKRAHQVALAAQTKRGQQEGILLSDDETWRELSVGVERFQAADCGILSTIADGLYDSISRVEDVSKRADLWDSLIILGAGAKIRGFKEALLQTICAKYLIPPSSGTIFSSELPTPTATGASTPMQQAQGQQGPNPLLVAATTHGMHTQSYAERHSSHGQTPLSIKTAKVPEYFSEWKECGFDEAAFLGAQVAAKVVFVIDQGANRGFMSRVEYNELGPEGVSEIF